MKMILALTGLILCIIGLIHAALGDIENWYVITMTGLILNIISNWFK